MLLLAHILSILGGVIILLAAINFSKARDAFGAIHFALLANIYGISILLLGIALKQLSLIALIKMLALILLNIIASLILGQILACQAWRNKITSPAEIIKLKSTLDDK
jgi:multisubunit Na+/H+ antiporter MnhG subunit